VRNALRHRVGAIGAALALLSVLAFADPATAPAAAAATTVTAADTAATASRPNAAMDEVAAMQPSTNIGNSLDAIPAETSWGNPPITKALFDTLRAQGYHSVRIPVTWSNHQSATAPYAIDPAFLARVRQVVDWALADGLYVDLNVHHDSWLWIENMAADHDGVLARFDATWIQIAAEFRDEPRRLLFESVNEPQFSNATDAQKTQFLNELNTAFHTIVRASGGGNASRLLILPTLGATPDQTLMDDLAAEMSTLNDHNLVATVHYYSFWPFSVNIAGYTTFNAATQQDLVDTFTRAYNTFVAKGIPVYVGEFGLLSYPDYTQPDTVEHGEALKYFEALGAQARTDHLTTALWDAGNYLNRDTLQWRDPALSAQIKSSWKTRSGTASSDNLFLPKTGPITDQTLTLNPNGTAFTRLRQGTKTLKPGVDYTLSGNQLTVKAAALTRLAGDRAYGIDATLQAEFRTGVPWQITIRTSDTPVQSAASGTDGTLTIPTQFRGDLLATMEATYADGSDAGPANWTPFQQFDTAFKPDYANGAIVLPAAFVSSLTDGARVALTFHFWSGATTTYFVTRTGTTVTGATS
jgi:endoglucanase